MKMRGNHRCILLSTGNKSSDKVFFISLVFEYHLSSSVNSADMTAEFHVVLLIWFVKDEEDVIESGHEGGGEIDVLLDGEFNIISAHEGVGGCEDCGSGV